MPTFHRAFVLFVALLPLVFAGCSKTTAPVQSDSTSSPPQDTASARPETSKPVSAGSVASAAAGLALLEGAFDFWGDVAETAKPSQPDAPVPDASENTGRISDEKQAEYKKILEDFEESAKRIEQLKRPETKPGGISYVDEEMGFGFAVNPGYSFSTPNATEYTINGEPAKMKVYVMNASDRDASCIAAMFHLPARLALDTPANTLIERGANDILNNWKIGASPVKVQRVIGSIPSELDESPGHEWWLEIKAGDRVFFSYITVYLKGTHLCTLVYTDTTEEALESEPCFDFLNSLVLY
ncbi:MAG: hypothetical protein IT367_09095 [Candidatus Hydrogenedentes bacterium]|nr:hypothetical protein [Candidatus Hydrogenedentota bacterium]